MDRLQDKVALVTGAGSGIGRASALAMAREGAIVLVSDVQDKPAEETVRLIEEAGGVAHAHHCDVTNEEDVRALVAAAVADHGRLDIAHNNAGWEGPLARVIDVDVEDFDRVIAINLRGVFLCLKHELPVMAEAGAGSIINTASVAGLVANQGAAPYSAAKHGVIGLTRTAAAEVARKGVRVNAVCPGWTDTPMAQRTSASNPRVMEGWNRQVPAGRVGTPEEIAATVVFLASDEAPFLTGAAVPVDGGWTAV